MDIQFHYQGTSGSPWMNEYLESRLSVLERYLPNGARIVVNFATDSHRTLARMSIRTMKRAFTFGEEGKDLYEAFTEVLEDALGTLREEYHRMIDHAHKKFYENPRLI
jgi:ribosome-associated translation inhibitor RaiA